MTRRIVNIPLSGVTKDDLTARVDEQHGSDMQIVQHATVGVTDLWMEFLSDVIGNRPLAGIGQDTYPFGVVTSDVIVVSGYLWTDGDPTNTQGLPVLSGTSSSPLYAPIRIGGYGVETNTKIRVVDFDANLVASSISEVSHSTYTGFAVCFDYANYATVHVRIYMNTGSGWVQEAHVDSGKSFANYFKWPIATVPVWGEPVGVGRGAKWRGLHLTLSHSTTAVDAPHLSAWPIYLSGGCVTPKAQGFYDQWSGAGSTHAIGTGLRWQDVGDTNDRKSPGSHINGGNDADGSIVTSAVYDEKQTFINAVDAHPIASVASPVIDNTRLAVTLRNQGGKVAANPIIRLGGVDVTKNDWTSGPTYQGQESSDLSRPGGGAWEVADFAPGAGLEWGARTFSAGESGGTAALARLTAISGPIPTYHTETLPTGDVGQAGQEAPIGTTGGKGRLFRPQYDHITNWRSGLGPVRDIARTGRSIERGTRNSGHSGSVRIAR